MYATNMSEVLHTLAAFAEMFDVAESIGGWFGKKAYSSECANNESKTSNFDAWTADSSGIGTDLTNDSRTNESASSRSSTPIDNSILDESFSADRQTKEDTVAQTSCKDTIEKQISALEDNGERIHVSENSYSTEANSEPSPSLNENSINICRESSNDEISNNKVSVQEKTVNNDCETSTNRGNDKLSVEESSVRIDSENSINKITENKPSVDENTIKSDFEISNKNAYEKKPIYEEKSDQIDSNKESNDIIIEEISNKIGVNDCVSNVSKSSSNEDIVKASDISNVQTNKIADESEEHSIKKFNTSSWNLEAITESLYAIAEPKSFKVPSSSSIPVDKHDGKSSNNLPENNLSISENGISTETIHSEDKANFQTTVFVMNEGIFVQYSPGYYIVQLQEQILQIKQEANTLVSIPLTYAEVTTMPNNVLKVDNRLGKCLFFKTDTLKELKELSQEFKLHCSKDWEHESLQLVHYPMKCHQNVVIVDLGSCSTRAGILMDQPTLPFLFFPSICATDRKTGNHVYGKEALQSTIRQNSHLSFPLRPSVKIIKHSIDIDLIGGLFKKIFQELRVDPSQYVVQVCLPRTLSISSQEAIVKLLLEDQKVQAVSLTHQALLTLYAHKASTGIVVDIGDRLDILPVVDGFIVDGGVTRLTYGGQRLIHHMKHALAQKHVSLSNDIDSFVVQYIAENLSYVAEDYDAEVQIAAKYPDMVKKTIALDTFAKDDKCAQSATLDDARFKTPEGLFKPELWGLDSPGVHKLVHKAIHATGVDVRKKIAEHIYVSGGVTLIPGFVGRLVKEVSELNKPRIVPKVIASNYRYHCTYIGACEFAKMDVFPKVCVNIEEYSKNKTTALKKFVLCF